MARDFDMEQELRAAGLANIAGGAVGGQIGYHLLGETVLAHKMGARSLDAAICISVASGLVLLFGAGLIGTLPIGLLAALIIMLGVGFIYEWVWAKRRQLPWGDQAVIMLIMVVAATIGFLEAFFTGLLAASIIFITSYARIDVVRLTTSAAIRHSSVERGATDIARIEARGDSVTIYELAGYLFFGTAYKLLDRIRNDMDGQEGGLALIIDFSRVTGLDSSAGFTLERLAAFTERRGQTLILTGLPRRYLKHFETANGNAAIQTCAKLDDALIEIEELILSQSPDAAPELDGLLADAKARYRNLDLSRFTSTVKQAAGTRLLEMGDSSNAVYRLLSGTLRAEIGGRGGHKMVVARFLPGALVGEIAYYSGSGRSADVLAETDCVLQRYDLDALDDSRDAALFARDFHRDAARLLSKRLIRMTRLVRDADL